VVRKICELFELELTYSQILNILGLERTSSTIAMLSSIRRGVTFKEITSEYNFKKDPHYIRRDNGYVSDICERLEQGFASKDILIDLGVPVTKNELHFISKVRNKLAFTSISSKYNI
jgi:hypothetical protein